MLSDMEIRGRSELSMNAQSVEKLRAKADRICGLVLASFGLSPRLVKVDPGA